MGEEDGGGGCCTEERKQAFSKFNAIVSAVMGMSSLGVAITAYLALAATTDDFQGIVGTWSVQPIGQVGFYDTVCPAGYANVSATWDGTLSACDCPASSGNGSSSTGSLTSPCSDSQLDDGCTTFDGIPAVNLLTWADGRVLCIERTGLPALQTTRWTGPGTCSATEIECSGGVATQQAFCHSGTLCPITDMAIVTNSTFQAGGLNETESSFAYTLGSTDYMLVLKRSGLLTYNHAAANPDVQTSYGLPLVELSILEGRPCRFGGCGTGETDAARVQEIAQDQLDFAAANPGTGSTLATPCTACSSVPGDLAEIAGIDIIDSRFVQVGFQNENQLYTNRTGIPTQFIPPTGINWGVTFRPQAYWNSANLLCPSFADASDVSGRLANVQTYQTMLLAAGILSFLVLTLYYPYQQFCNSEEYEEEGMKKKSCYFKLFIKVTTIVFVAMTMVVASGTLAFFNDISVVNCFAPASEGAATFLGGRMDNLVNNNVVASGVKGAESASDFIELGMNAAIGGASKIFG